MPATADDREPWARPNRHRTAVRLGEWPPPVSPGRVRVELRPRLAGPGFLVTGTLRLHHEVEAGTSVRLRLG